MLYKVNNGYYFILFITIITPNFQIKLLLEMLYISRSIFIVRTVITRW